MAVENTEEVVVGHWEVVEVDAGVLHELAPSFVKWTVPRMWQTAY